MKTVINIWCDRKGCTNQDSVYSDNRDDCNRILFERGWVLYEGKHYCHEHLQSPRSPTLRAADTQATTDALVHDIISEMGEYIPLDEDERQVIERILRERLVRS